MVSEFHGQTFIGTTFYGCVFVPEPPLIHTMDELPEELRDNMDTPYVSRGGQVWGGLIYGGTFYGCFIAEGR